MNQLIYSINLRVEVIKTSYFSHCKFYQKLIYSEKMAYKIELINNPPTIPQTN